MCKTISPGRTISPAGQLIIEAKTQELVDACVMYKYKDPTCCAVNPVIAAKMDPDNGLWTEHRMAQGYHAVNQHTPHDQYSMHWPEEIIQKVGKAEVFSKLDCARVSSRSPWWKVTRPKPATGWGTVSWLTAACPTAFTMPMHTFSGSWSVEIVPAGLYHCAIAFIDDVSIWSDSQEHHEKASRLC